MSNDLMPSACETDIAGTVSMYALTPTRNKPSALIDRAANLLLMIAWVSSKPFFGEGKTTNDLLSRTPGNNAVVELTDLQGLMRFVSKNGFAHHCAMTDAFVANVFEESLDYYLGGDVYHHQG